MAASEQKFSSRKAMINTVMGYKPKKKKNQSGGAEAPADISKKRVSVEEISKRLANQPKNQSTTRGKRRLSFEQAYARRTTDSSRARVQALYGKKAPPKGYGGTGSFQPVPADQVGKSKPLTPPGPTRRKRRSISGGAVAPY